MGWREGNRASRQSHFDTRGNAAHSNEMVISAAADFHSLCYHPPTSRKARQAMLTTPTGNLPSEQRLSRSLQLLRDLSGAEKCHRVPVLHAQPARGTVTTSAHRHSWGFAGRGEQELGRSKQVLLLRVCSGKEFFPGLSLVTA